MKIGFLTSCLPDSSLVELLRWAQGTEFDTLEVAAWPQGSERRYKGCHLDVDSLNTERVEELRSLLQETGLSISALAYYDNILDPSLGKRNAVRSHLLNVVNAAALLKVGLVGTFVGANPALTPGEALKEIVREFREILNYAKDRGVRVMIENCPMTGWQAYNAPGNLAYSPELWEILFHELPFENFGLNFDPSHLYWLGIDHTRAIREFRDRIFHVHAKDCEILPEGLYRFGRYGPQTSSPRDPGWWRYRLPGNGDIDWKKFFGVLREVDYRGTVSLELEDPEWEGSPDQTKKALLQGAKFLFPLAKEAE